MPVGYLPAPAQGGILPATSVGPGTVQPGAPQGMGGGGQGAAGLQQLIKAIMLAKQRKPPVPGQAAAGPPGWLGPGTGPTPGAGDPNAFLGAPGQPAPLS